MASASDGRFSPLAFRASIRAIELATRAALLVGALALTTPGRAQDTALLPNPPAAPALSADDPLPGLRKPADIPPSLYMPPAPAFSCDPLPGCYFDCDQRLDPPILPQPGWAVDAELQIGQPHVRNQVRGPVSIGGGPAHDVMLPSATLDWTAAPRIELSHRLPEGFGEFAIAYRFLGSEGNSTFAGPDGTESLSSNLFLNVLDLDYASNELSICPWWLKWRVGIRAADAFFESRAEQSAAAASGPGGSGIIETQVRDNFWGVGLHGALEAERRIEDYGLIFLARIDLGSMLGRVNQSFLDVTTTPGLVGETRRSNAMEVPVVTASAGVAWRPPRCQPLRFFLGYQYEYWWNVGRFPGQISVGEIEDQGILLRADFNY